jgi:putative ABC transport system substrate-binding protein
MKTLLKYAAGAAIAAAVLAGCAKKKADTPVPSGKVTIGISKIVAHDALDAVEQGLIDRVLASGREVTFNRQNAAGDVNTAAQIATLFKNEKVAVAVGIATPSAVALANNIKDIPVVFSAVTNPITAGLVDSYERGKGNVTGVSDAIDIPMHIRIFKEIAGVKTIGFIYSSGEDNSISSLADVRDACSTQGIALVEQAITNSSELKQAAQSIIGRVDGVYTSSDNTVHAAIAALLEVCNTAKKPLFSADVTSCRNGGALVAYGFDYYKTGLATGDIVLQILDGKKPADIPTRFLTERGDIDFLIDLDQAANCGITVPEEYLEQANLIFYEGKLTKK